MGATAEGTAGYRWEQSQSLVAAKMGKVPPQQGKQGQGPIKLEAEVLHHLQVLLLGEKQQQDHSNK